MLFPIACAFLLHIVVNIHSVCSQYAFNMQSVLNAFVSVFKRLSITADVVDNVIYKGCQLFCAYKVV